MIILLSLTGVALCSKKVVDITGGGDCLTINGCNGADTVFIKNGEYIEEITLRAGCIYIGESRDGVVIKNPNGPVILIGRDNNANIENVTVAQGNIRVNQSGSMSSDSYDEAKIIIKNCVVKTYIDLRYTGSLEVYNSVFLGSGTKIFTSGSSYNNKYHKIINNIFTNSENVSIQILGGGGEITNNLYHSISNTAIYTSNKMVASYNCFYEVTTNTSGTADIYSVGADPKLEDIANGDYRPKSDSPLLDVGHPTVTYNDPDGSRSDIGLYGGQYSWGKKPQLTAISFSETTV